MSNAKAMIIHLIAGLIKKTLQNEYLKIIHYFPKRYEPFGGDINVKIGLSNYATKTDLKNAIVNDPSKLALKSNLLSLKAKVGKTDVSKLKLVPADLSKLRNLVDNDFVWKIVW